MLLVTDGDGVSGAVDVVAEHGGIRVLVADSISFASPDDQGQVIVTGSHGGASAGEYARRFGVAAMVCSDAGIGKDAAGVAGLEMIDRAGIMGIAVSHESARIGDGRDIWDHGIISFANRTALAAGIRREYPVRDELMAFLYRRREPGPGEHPMRRTVLEHQGRQVVILDSMSQVEDADRGQVVIAASNGGKESGRLAVAAGCACAVFSDAGLGKDQAGIAGIWAMDAAGIPGITVSHTSAAISDGMDIWRNGVISHVNSAAAAAGFSAGARAADAVIHFLSNLER
jgi:hypothetical protein